MRRDPAHPQLLIAAHASTSLFLVLPTHSKLIRSALRFLGESLLGSNDSD